MYNGLDTKSVQMDSLAHILYPSLIPLGAFARADKEARQMESFYRTNEREVSIYLNIKYLHYTTNMALVHYYIQASLVYLNICGVAQGSVFGLFVVYTNDSIEANRRKIRSCLTKTFNKIITAEDT